MLLLKALIFTNYIFQDILAPPPVPVPYEPTPPLVEPTDVGFESWLTPKPQPYDEHGCCISCGYSYCPELAGCVRVWETICPSLIKTGH